ncbi:hypothetical protein ABFS82_11G084400 [Erythranthe guttata]
MLKNPKISPSRVRPKLAQLYSGTSFVIIQHIFKKSNNKVFFYQLSCLLTFFLRFPSLKYSQHNSGEADLAIARGEKELRPHGSLLREQVRDKVVAKYSVLGQGQHPLDDKDLDHFMTHYVLLLSSFKEQLQQHVRVHAMEAVMACWELEQSLQSLTGVAPGEGTGATMSDDDEDQADSETNLFDESLDGGDNMGFGPLVPTETERSLMERVRLELKHELKQGYKEKIVDIREEILRKRRAGKLPGDTTSVLKSWWQSHSKWPYPTEEDKARLVQETGLQLKQINNWFINQRKRNWHSNPSSSTPKSKRKSGAGDKTGNERFA